MTVFRCFVQKKAPFATEAAGVKQDLLTAVRSGHVEAVRVFNRYDLENIEEQDFLDAARTILSEPQVDDLYIQEAPKPSEMEWVLAVEYLPGQFDQRADSAAQCIQLSTCKARPVVRTARLYYIQGNLSEEDKKIIRETLINPVEAREASLECPETIVLSYEKPELPPIMEGFIDMGTEDLQQLHDSMGLAMDLADLEVLRNYFRDEEKRNPRETEIRVIDTYWSDHCRHTTFNTILKDVTIEPENVKKTYEDYLACRKEVYAGRKEKPITLMDLATIGAKALKKAGKLKDLDESEEINACSVKIKVDVDGEDQDWLLMFKNETHNHPTEIEPFGGAATCLGGAIRDPLSGRSYVYQAMRVTGAADPLVPIEQTLKGKLPQRKLTTTAAHGYSSYGNQIGLATGHVHELYHPGYVAKRMEVGAVMAAAPAENVIREVPAPGDIVILLGGRTGRDGCGGATGSSKSHTVESLETCGAEVQKGNAPEERKLQRLFRTPEAAKLIKRCNDFGAGGVSVAIGELADGLRIDLNAVPKKYEGLNSTELAISESQERMAVVVRSEDVETFRALAEKENLESTVVAVVTEEPRLVMELDGEKIVNLSRAFLDTNGAKRYADAWVETKAEATMRFEGSDFSSIMKNMVQDLNVASQKGLVERFDSTIGSNTVLMPFGGKRQLSEEQVMAARIPLLQGNTDTVSLMSYGFDPYRTSADCYAGAMDSVVSSVAKVVVSGGSRYHTWLSFQEFFGHTWQDPKRWGKPLEALLGAWKAQMALGTAAIGGKDSMSGTFENLDVPPTLISFAVSTTKADRVVSGTFEKAGDRIWLLEPKYKNQEVDLEDVCTILDRVEELEKQGVVKAARVCECGGLASALFKGLLGNDLGFKAEAELEDMEWFKDRTGAILLESEQDIEGAMCLGTITEEPQFTVGSSVCSMHELQELWEKKLEPVFAYRSQPEEKKDVLPDVHRSEKMHASYHVEHPRVLIPVFPGTNCEWDTARAFEAAGAETKIFVLRNRTSKEIEESVAGFAQEIHKAQIVALPGGFSGGDEPEGSAKFIVAFFRNPVIKEAIEDLLEHREGLMLGICNGFQALIKLGLVPFGRIVEPSEHNPTLTFNTINRHQSMLVKTRVLSNKSPWLSHLEVGDVTTVAISHGEGRFVADEKTVEELAKNGQIAFQYVNDKGEPTQDIRYNPNNSVLAIESITSLDGRILGKMGHSERSGKNLYRNIPDAKTQESIFTSAVEYFR